MEPRSAWYQTCFCGRTFLSPQAHSYHQRSCQKSKKRLSDAIGKARDATQAKKCPKLNAEGTPSRAIANEGLSATGQPFNSIHPLPDIEVSSPISASSLADQVEVCQSAAPCDPSLDQALAIRRPRRENRLLPKRYRDLLPTSLSAQSSASSGSLPAADVLIPLATSPLAQPTELPRNGVTRTPTDNFGLYRQYHMHPLSIHDGNVHIAPDVNAMFETPKPAGEFYPYPNQTTFLLGEWYWNGGEKKSQSSFRKLLEIVGHPDFRPEDVSGTNWRHIDAWLGGSNHALEDHLSQPGWLQTPIKITVPFHKKMLRPGRTEYEAGVLYHRNLVSVIKEKFGCPTNRPYLHFEPYELFWRPNESSEPVRVYGEIYTSSAFVEAHDELQRSPEEPGCGLPRVVAALMFASDSTQLTSFSSAKLWPVYLGFGNESKERRSKPSCQCWEHVAYFETVRLLAQRNHSSFDGILSFQIRLNHSR